MTAVTGTLGSLTSCLTLSEIEMNGFLSHACDLVSVGDRDNVYYCLDTRQW